MELKFTTTILQNEDIKSNSQKNQQVLYEYPENTYDFVISNLVLHYIADLDFIFKSVFRTLKMDGIFLFNIEHPVFTSGVNEDWIYS